MIHGMYPVTAQILKFNNKITFSSRSLVLKPRPFPNNPKTGMLHYDSISNILYYYNDSKWYDLTLSNQLENLITKYNASHYGTGEYKSSSGESVFLYADSPQWKTFRSDGFINFNKPDPINAKVTFNGEIFNSSVDENTRATTIDMANSTIQNVRPASNSSEIVNKNLATTQRDKLVSSMNSEISEIIADIKAEHKNLQYLWDSRQITASPSTDEYIIQKYMYDQFIEIVQDLVDSGQITTYKG